MRKTYKIGEVANILGVSADTIRYYEKAGIVYSKKDSSNGYRYFTPADIYALLDVLFYRSMDIPVEEVRNIMNFYQHRDVKIAGAKAGTGAGKDTGTAGAVGTYPRHHRGLPDHGRKPGCISGAPHAFDDSVS